MSNVCSVCHSDEHLSLSWCPDVAEYFVVETGVHGATRINRHEYLSCDEAVARAKRWSQSNSTGSYWAEVEHHARGVKLAVVTRFNLEPR